MFHCLFSKLSVTTRDPSGNHVGTAVPSPSRTYVAREGYAPLRLRRNAARPLRGGQSPFHNWPGGDRPHFILFARGQSPFHNFGCKKERLASFRRRGISVGGPCGT